VKVSELGEFGLIELLAEMTRQARDEKAPAWRNLLIGIGDDAAAWRRDSAIELVTVDSFIQDIHFISKFTPWKEAGWKALAVNLSDIAAMGGSPRYAVVSLALPDDAEADDMIALYQGMIELAREFGVAIVGGDTCRAPQVIINITVIGSTASPAGDMLTRSGAKAGDKIAVTGSLGAASAGWEMLSKGLRFDTETASQLRQPFMTPRPRVAEGQLLVEHGLRAGIDISDGLVADLGHVCQASQVGARLDVDLIPIHPAVRNNFGEQALTLALSGGEDYELLFTGSAPVIDRVRKIAPFPVTVIGEMVAGDENKVTLVDRQGNPFALAGGGWDHFKRQ